MDSRPRRRESSWLDDARGGLRSIGLEALVIIALGLVSAILAWVAITVV